MINKEEYAVRIITDYLKEEKDIQTKNARNLTQEEQPPDYYFEIGDHKIGCEVEHFHVKEAGNNLEKELDLEHKIGEKAERSLQEKGIPVLALSFGFTPPPTEVHKNVEKIVNIITIMHNESITDSHEYKRNNCEKYYDLFLDNNIDYIRYQLTGQKGLYRSYSPRPHITRKIKAEEMRGVIRKKDKDIPTYKECYDQKWLIITNYGNIGLFILKDAAEEVQYKCNFDNVLYIEWRGIEPKPRKQKQTGSLIDKFAVYELNGARRS